MAVMTSERAMALSVVFWIGLLAVQAFGHPPSWMSVIASLPFLGFFALGLILTWRGR